MPEDVVGWYKEHVFHFVALSDHDHPPVGERWKKVTVPKDPEDMSETAHPEILAQYRKRYGDDWVQTRMRDGVREVRLKPVSEFGPLVNESDRFLATHTHLALFPECRRGVAQVEAGLYGALALSLARVYFPGDGTGRLLCQ